MLILAFDTTTEQGGAALYRDHHCLAQIPNSGAASYSTALFEMVDSLLAETRLRLGDVDLFAAATGPGSFTGIRVGLAAAQGWAQAFARPVRGVSVLEAMVEAVRPRAGTVVPLLDARRGEFYLGVFRPGAAASLPAQATATEDGFALVGEGLVLGPAAVATLFETLQRGEGLQVAAIAREHDAAARELGKRLPAPVELIITPDFMVEAIARLALRAAREGKLQKPEELDACYIRRSDAELHWRE
jgi:tRNA threonylcarbamoyladenosine biosynthesis protein TsaB